MRGNDEESADRWWAHGMRTARRLAAELPGIPVEVATVDGHVVVDPD